MSRSPEQVGAPVEGRFGDYDAPESLPEAYRGLDRLLLIPSTALRPGDRARQYLAAIDAAVAAGVKHIVVMSAAGTHQEDEPAIRAAYWAAEQHVMRTAPGWTILRANYFAEALVQEARMSLAGGVLTGPGENRVGFVSRDDVAAAATGILLGEGHAGAIYNATGPVAVTGAERAALVAEVSGKPMSYLVLSEAHLLGGLAQANLPAEVVNAIRYIQLNFVEGGYDIVTGDVERLAGRPPRTLREVLAAML